MSGSTFNFEFDERAFKKIAQEALDESGRQFQQELGRLQRTHSGQPVDEVKRHVRQAFGRIGVKASESEITDYATAISSGTKIKVQVDRLR